ncbi:TPA: NAD-dependent epimerase/dehydratase family protein [Legionella pneumophila]|nr:NAD-dependent epimerase/dehydratase family protein [Legionella pneumophila]HAT1864027.1 NAD-dependent epimerase/dehydratase family protein [Legionella pneumophila]HBB6940693.1 NAD-dependent epimerase/dehydratase family protein [Legionella pneumophila]HBB6941152.1 NAD-dependent epimerase/dehydratase family protein [Legionella pneumophila]HBD7345063.1 NAD-dependent epimerase/dehydratase family protein [Legionella pneumophila]HBD7346484.1 NAD-dependent epimerase/dehydratase family protein [Leg
MNKEKNILVTGAAGFIGSFLCEELISHDYRIIGIDNFFRGKPDNIKHLIQSDFILEDLDLSSENNIKRLRKIIEQHHIEIVFHLAAINGTQYFYDRPLFVLDQNIRITQNLLSAIKSTCVNYIIYTSSSEVYGDPLIIPTHEKHPIHLAMDDRDSYAASKAIGDFYIRLFSKQNNLSYLILRVFNLYGERMIGTKYGQVIPEFIHRILYEDRFTIIGNGSNTRSFCYIKDATWAIRELVEKKISGVVNLGNDKEISILELAKMIHHLEKKSFNPVILPARPNDHARRQPDISHLKSILTNICFTDLKTGLEKLLLYYKFIRSSAPDSNPTQI